MKPKKKPKKYELLEVRIMTTGETNASLAEYLGIHESTVFKKRTGDYEFSIREVKALAKLFNFSSEEIVEVFKLG